MEIKHTPYERKETNTIENEERRQYIIDNYKEFIPDIEDYIYERKNPKFDYRFLSRKYKEERLQKRYNELSNIIVDIRNNTSATNYYSNSINKTDNRFSNETKKMVRHLLSKGWSNNEIAYEMEKIYGTGVVSYYTGLEKEPTVGSILFYSGLKLFSIYLAYRTGKNLIGRYSKNKILSK
jgi:uncharacterized protein (UPF0305 family)